MNITIINCVINQENNIVFFNLPADGFDGGPEWSLPADGVQTSQLIFRPHLHHPDSCPRSRQCCVHRGGSVPWLLAQPQEFHLSAGTGKVCVWLSECATGFGLYIMKFSPLQFIYLLVLTLYLESTASALAYFHYTKV